MKSMFCLVIGMALLASVSAFSAQKSGVPVKAKGDAAANQTPGSCVGKADDDVALKNAAICKAAADKGFTAKECTAVSSKGDTGSQSTTK